MSTAAERLAAARQRVGLSQRKLAALSAPDPADAQQVDSLRTYINQIERGKIINPGGENLRRLAAALGTTVDELVGDGGNAPSIPDDVESDPIFRQIRAAFLTARGHLSRRALEPLARLIVLQFETYTRAQIESERGPTEYEEGEDVTGSNEPPGGANSP